MGLAVFIVDSIQYCYKLPSGSRVVASRKPYQAKNFIVNELTLSHSNVIPKATLVYDNLSVNKLGRTVCSKAFSKQFSEIFKE